MTRPQVTSWLHWALLAPCLLSVVPASAQRRSPRLMVLREMQHDVSPPLWQMAAHAAETPEPSATSESLPAAGSPEEDAVGESDDQTSPPQFATIGLNFEGISAAIDPGQVPPDTNGAAGATQFVQWVNVKYAVYSKTTGALILGPLPGNTIWSGFPGPCATVNSGQPIAQYDKAAGRWVLAQPVLVSPFTYCMAVSTSSDATGSYYRYAFTFADGNYPDYGKLAVWPDAYYASFNIYQGGPAGKFLGPMVVAYDRTMMLTGRMARGPIAFQLTSADFSLLPSDFDGTVPPVTGEPNLYLELGADSDSLDLFKFHVDFSSPGGS
ncbi:MAG TPA: hypothetical protein VN648_22130, partial [Candidatus Methylomirabilis sp.]|nr:hypothetical protein [Candidatus Methylomirabilis sp.]